MHAKTNWRKATPAGPRHAYVASASLPPSQTDKDEIARRGGTGAKANLQAGVTLRTTTAEYTVTVETCGARGADLSGIDPVGREHRILYDIVFGAIERRVDADVKECPDCRIRTTGRCPTP